MFPIATNANALKTKVKRIAKKYICKISFATVTSILRVTKGCKDRNNGSGKYVDHQSYLKSKLN